jgi:class 3 adenylate cyclase/pimeloyl-ACP methyl ester carboxylesterase
VNPETRYAETVDGVFIAYQVVGDGPWTIVLVYSPFASNVELAWEWPFLADQYHRLAGVGRLVLFDRRGAGLSDRVSGDRLPTLEARMDDIRCVMDAVGAERAVLYGVEDGAAQCLLFAATYPERTQAVITVGAAVRGTWAPDAPWAWNDAEWEEELRLIRRNWGSIEFAREYARIAVPGHADDPEFVRAYARMMRHSLSPSDALAADQMWRDTDVRHVLPSIQAPTLVMHHAGDNVEPVEEGRYIASEIAGAVYKELPGADHTIGDVTIVEQFLATLQAEQEVFDRLLATVLFTDIVDSTPNASALGDHEWQAMMGRHESAVRALLGRYRGTEMNTTGDGFFATFDGPARAIRCAQAIVHAVEPLGIQVRAGLHTGEIELVHGKANGIAVNIGARVCAKAGPSEVLVSHTVTDLVAGSGISFDDAGEHELKGLDGRWKLYRAVPATTAG